MDILDKFIGIAFIAAGFLLAFRLPEARPSRGGARRRPEKVLDAERYTTAAGAR